MSLVRLDALLANFSCPSAVQGIANRLKQALNLDAKAGGTPDAAQNAAAGPTSATPGGPGTNQSSTGMSNMDTMQSSGTGGMTNSGMMGNQTTESRSGGVASPVGPGTDQSSEGLSSTGGHMQSGTTGELREGGTTGMSTGQTGELRTGGGTSTTTGGSNVSTMGTIASTGIPHSSEMPLPVRIMSFAICHAGSWQILHHAAYKFNRADDVTETTWTKCDDVWERPQSLQYRCFHCTWLQDRDTLTSSAEHWDKAEAAMEAARRQVLNLLYVLPARV